MDSGGYIEGFVYFERVDPLARGVVFEYDLVDADDGEEIATAQLRFDVVP